LAFNNSYAALSFSLSILSPFISAEGHSFQAQSGVTEQGLERALERMEQRIGEKLRRETFLALRELTAKMNFKNHTDVMNPQQV
jgi:hypothetical protein